MSLKNGVIDEKAAQDKMRDKRRWEKFMEEEINNAEDDGLPLFPEVVEELE